MFLYVEKEQIWVQIVSTGGKVNSQNEHLTKSCIGTPQFRSGVKDNVVPVPGQSWMSVLDSSPWEPGLVLFAGKGPSSKGMGWFQTHFLQVY